MSTSSIAHVNTSAAPVAGGASPKQAQAGKTSPATQSAAQTQSAAAGAVVSAAAAALKEATETSAQTVKEAAHGDRVAQRLLAKESAASAARRGGSVKAAPSRSTAGARGSIIDEKA